MTLKEAIVIVYGLVVDMANDEEEAEAVDVFSNYLKEQGLHPWPEREVE